MKLSFFSFLLLSCCLFSCQNNNNKLQIIIGKNASQTEKITAQDLKADLSKVTDLNITIISENEVVKEGMKILIGTSSSNQLMSSMLKEASVSLRENEPGARGGIWHKSVNTIILAGSDVQGMQYAVYDYAKEVLGIDPLQYWTGQQAKKITPTKLFQFDNQTIPAPKVPLLVYFENDVDELANLKKPLLEYDWESYTQLIDALVRLRYNGIQFFDMLGRPEFFLRPTYQKIRPDYDIDINYIEKMIDYAHDKGMKVQIDMSMGYKIKSLASEYADCWSGNKEKWLEVWNYYLKETPIGKADIYSLRPRNQVWDWEYKSTCGEDKIKVFNEVYSTLDTIITQHNPKADKIVICYHDGMDMFNNGFNPPKDWIIAWSDDGYAGFKHYPTSTKGYQFGTYMHAGFWKNHTIGHPYPEQIDTIMHRMFREYNATSYCQVNGQQFRPFLLNIEAFSEVCRAPDTYTGIRFYQTWASRYFDKELTKEVIELMQFWDKASFGKTGYVQHLWEIREAIAYLSMSPIERPGKKPTAYTAERVENDLETALKRYKMMQNALAKADKLLPKVSDNSYFFHDQIHLPLQLYVDLLDFEQTLHELYRVKRQYEMRKSVPIKKAAHLLLQKARNQLSIIYKNSLKGDRNPRWKGWYNPAQRRPNNGFPTVEMLNAIELAIEEKWSAKL